MSKANVFKNKKGILAITLIGLLLVIGVVFVYLGENSKKVETGLSQDPMAAGPGIVDNGSDIANRSTELSTPVPDYKAPVANGIVGDEKPEIAEDPSSFVEVQLPFTAVQGVQIGSGFDLLANQLKPNEEFTSRIYIEGQASDSELSFDSHTVSADAIGQLDAPFALPTNLSEGLYTLLLTSPERTFEVHFSLTATGNVHAAF